MLVLMLFELVLLLQLMLVLTLLLGLVLAGGARALARAALKGELELCYCFGLLVATTGIVRCRFPFFRSTVLVAAVSVPRSA